MPSGLYDVKFTSEACPLISNIGAIDVPNWIVSVTPLADIDPALDKSNEDMSTV